MRIGLIGLGDIAQKAYLPILTEFPSVEPVLCTRSRKVLSELAKKYRVNDFCCDYKQLLNMDVDAVMIHSATWLSSGYVLVKPSGSISDLKSLQLRTCES